MKLKDAIPTLADMLKASGARVTLDLDADVTKPCFICGTKETPRKLVVVGTWSRFMGTRGDPGGPIRRPMCAGCDSASSAPRGSIVRGSIVRRNAEADPNYCPYCLRCNGLVRMKKTEKPLVWKCDCGAVHDESTM